MIKTDIGLVKEQHPCFSHEAHFRYGRVHLPVAPRCNIQCGYCVRSITPLEERPGVTERILSSPEALEVLRDAVKRHPSLRVVAVAGLGEPLANRETFEVLKMAKEEFPRLVTVVGEIQGVRALPLGEIEYTYTFLKARKIHLWETRPETIKVYHEYPLYPYRYPYWWGYPYWW